MKTLYILTKAIKLYLTNESFYAIKYTKVSVLIAFLSLFGYNSISQCTFRIQLRDSYGDGWNGGSINSVSVAGTVQLSNLSLSSANGTDWTTSGTFTASVGQPIAITYSSGSWCSENTYRIQRNYGGAWTTIYTSNTCPTGTYTITNNGCGSAPPNPCAAAINITSLPVNNQSVVCSSSNNLNSSNVPACGGASTSYMGGNEALYTITPSTSGPYTISYNGVTWSSIWVWANACPASGGTCVGSVSSSASAKTLNVNLTAGVTYYVMFDTYPSPVSPCPGTFSITAPVPPPANDLICSATAITCGQTLNGTTVNATNSGTGENGFCGTSQTQPGVWYVVPGNGQQMTASLCGTAWDSKISVFSGPNCSSLTCVGGGDDNGPACAGSSASYAWNSVSGTNYYILVHGYSSTSAFSLNLSCVTLCGGPVNPGVISTNLTQTVDNDVVSWTVTGGDPIIRYEYMLNNSGTWTTLANTAQNLSLQLFSQGGDFEIRSVHCTPGCPVANSNSVTTNLECAPQFTNGPIDGDHITNVTLNSINNNSTSDFGDGNSPLSIDAYQNYTSLVTDLSKGSVYNLSVSGTSTFGSNQGFAAWIDWNGDGSFDVSENVLISGPTPSTTASVNVPTTAITGLVKMRVLCAWDTTPTADACAALDYSYGEIEEYSINIMEASTLPVTLLSFDSSCEDDYVRLNWRTESELNSSHFIVERSRDGNTWTKSLPISAAGTTNTLQSYSYNDLIAGQNFEGYYRLRQVDFDGQEEVFGPISAHCKGLDNNYMEVFPNPTNGNFTLRIHSDRSMDNTEVTIVNAQGKVVHQQLNTITNGSTTLFFKRNDLEVGLYFVHINAPSIKIAPQKIIIH